MLRLKKKKPINKKKNKKTMNLIYENCFYSTPTKIYTRLLNLELTFRATIDSIHTNKKRRRKRKRQQT